jgi:hypothetical protein
VQRDPYFGCFPLQRFTLDTGWWKGHCWPFHRDTPAAHQTSDRVRNDGRRMAWLAALVFKLAAPTFSFPRSSVAILVLATRFSVCARDHPFGYCEPHRASAAGSLLAAWWFSARQALPSASPGVLSPSAYWIASRCPGLPFSGRCRCGIGPPHARPLNLGRCRWACPCGFSLTLAAV